MYCKYDQLHNCVECRWPVVMWSKLSAVYDYGVYNIKVMVGFLPVPPLPRSKLFS